MANCEQCGYTLECHAGCGIFCRNDCTDCILWCEPHDHVMVMRREEQGDGARTRVSTTEGLDRAAGAPRYSEDEEFRVCFNQLPRDVGSTLERYDRSSSASARRPRCGKDKRLHHDEPSWTR